MAWKKFNGTIRAFNLYYQVLISITGLKFLFLYKVQKLAIKLADFHPTIVDMCFNSCIACADQYCDYDKCFFIIKSQYINKICNEPCYKNQHTNKKKSRAQVQILSVMSTIHVIFYNADIAK